MAIFCIQITYCHNYDRVSVLPPDRFTRESGQDSQQKRTKEHVTLPKSAKMETQPTTPTYSLSFGLKNINDTNKISKVTYCLIIYLPSVPLFPWLESSGGPRPPRFRSIVITVRLGLRWTTAHDSRQRVRQQLLNPLATKSEQMKLKSVQLYSLLAG